MAAFKGFKDSGYTKIARAMGYTGPMDQFQNFLASNPAMQQKMNDYTNKAIMMAKGGQVKNYRKGGVGYTGGGTQALASNLIDPTTLIKGVRAPTDAKQILQVATNKALKNDPAYLQQYDINKDGKITSSDALAFSRAMAEKRIQEANQSAQQQLSDLKTDAAQEQQKIQQDQDAYIASVEKDQADLNAKIQSDLAQNKAIVDGVTANLAPGTGGSGVPPINLNYEYTETDVGNAVKYASGIKTNPSQQELDLYDLNKDGNINISDVVNVTKRQKEQEEARVQKTYETLKSAVGITKDVPEETKQELDVNKDGVLDIQDVIGNLQPQQQQQEPEQQPQPKEIVAPTSAEDILNVAVSGSRSDPAYLDLYDINKDGKITSSDALAYAKQNLEKQQLEQIKADQERLAQIKAEQDKLAEEQAALTAKQKETAVTPEPIEGVSQAPIGTPEFGTSPYAATTYKAPVTPTNYTQFGVQTIQPTLDNQYGTQTQQPVVRPGEIYQIRGQQYQAPVYTLPLQTSGIPAYNAPPAYWQQMASGGYVTQQNMPNIPQPPFVPNQMMVNNQPHRLAYVNPNEERMMQQAGGMGISGPNNIPMYVGEEGSDAAAGNGNETQQMDSSTIGDYTAGQMYDPTLAPGTVVGGQMTYYDPQQYISPVTGQISGDRTVGSYQASTTMAEMPTPTGAAQYAAGTSSQAVNAAVSATQAAQTNPNDPRAQVTAAQATRSSVSDLNAAQGTAVLMDNPTQRKLQSGELISGVADANTAAKFTEQIQAATATPSQKATVQGQLEGLMQQFEGGDTPAWAAGAMRNVMASMAARGIGASSLAGQAAVQAAMESALPIAQADASTQAQFESQNLSNRQQRAMLAAQQRAQFLGQEFDQKFQARVANASKISDIANMNFTAEQQVALENSRIANTMNLANLSNSQAMVMAEAAALANMDMANLSNRQQAAVMNAQNFLQMDMANLSNQQQTEMFKAQSRVQSLFTDQAATNAAAQFNATSQNQVDQFFANLSSQVATFNASQANAQAQFNAGQANATEKFNAEIANQRDQFNAQNQIVIAQSNAQWRRSIATADTATTNRVNELNAMNMLGISNQAYNNLWQLYGDTMDWAFESSQNELDRDASMALAILTADQNKSIAELKTDAAAMGGWAALGASILGSDAGSDIISSAWDGFVGLFS